MGSYFDNISFGSIDDLKISLIIALVYTVYRAFLLPIDKARGLSCPTKYYNSSLKIINGISAQCPDCQSVKWPIPETLITSVQKGGIIKSYEVFPGGSCDNCMGRRSSVLLRKLMMNAFLLYLTCFFIRFLAYKNLDGSDFFLVCLFSALIGIFGFIGIEERIKTGMAYLESEEKKLMRKL